MLIPHDQPLTEARLRARFDRFIAEMELDDGRIDASVWQLVEDGIEPFDWEGIPPWKRR